MTDSEFLEMSRLLDTLTKGADTLREVFSKKTVEDKEMAIRTGGVKTTRDVFTDEAKAHPDFKRKYFLLPNREINALVALINGCKDWTSEKHKASALYQKMRAFISASSGMPIGVSTIYNKLRSKCLELMDLIVGRYPDLLDGQSSPTVREEDHTFHQGTPTVQSSIRSSPLRRGEKVRANPDYNKLATCFNDSFRTPLKGEKQSRFEKLCRILTNPATAFCPKDWGRIAYAIKMNAKIRDSRVYYLSHAKWMVEFFGIMDLPLPADTRPKIYQDQAGTHSFITNYLSV